MVQIVLLADHDETIPTLARWFRAESPDYYGERTLADIEEDFRAEMERDRLPLRLIAFAADELVGTIVLREQALDTQSQFRPGLGGLYVVESQRGHGIGTALVEAGMTVARELGYEIIYVGTETAGGILERLGWEHIESVLHRGEWLTIYRCSLHETVK